MSIALAPALLFMAASSQGGLSRAGRLFGLSVVSTIGLASYAAFLQVKFGDAWAFAKTQTYWRTHPDNSMQKWPSLLTLEPIHATFQPASSRYWMLYDCQDNPLYSMAANNPIWFSLAVLAIIYGAWRRWLNAGEFIAGLGLLAIPYLTRSYEFSGLSSGRFASVMLPAYAVLARLLRDAPNWMLAVLGATSLVLFSFYVALFVAGYRFF